MSAYWGEQKHVPRKIKKHKKLDRKGIEKAETLKHVKFQAPKSSLN